MPHTLAERILLAPANVRHALVQRALCARTGAKIDPNISAFDRAYIYIDPTQSAISRLRRVLFPWMVMDFRGHPTKTKAMCIFSMSLPKVSQKDDRYTRLKEVMERVESDSKMAKSMSWFERVRTSSGRKVDANIFDDMFKRHMQGTGDDFGTYMNDLLFKDVVEGSGVQAITPQIAAEAEQVRLACKAADFNMRNLGMPNSFL